MYYVTDTVARDTAEKCLWELRAVIFLFSSRDPASAERMNLTMTLFSLRRRQSVLADSGEIASKIITNSCQCSILPPPSARCKMNGLDKTNTWLDLICTLFSTELPTTSTIAAQNCYFSSFIFCFTSSTSRVYKYGHEHSHSIQFFFYVSNYPNTELIFSSFSSD